MTRENTKSFQDQGKCSLALRKENRDLFRLCPPPPPVLYAPPVTEHVELHIKSLCKNMTRASGGGGGGVKIICAY